MPEVRQREGSRGRARRRGYRSVCALLHGTASGGEVEAPSSLKKLTAWEAIAHVPEGVRTMIPWLTFTEHLPRAGPLLSLYINCLI